MNGQIDEQPNRQMNERIDKQTNKPMVRQTYIQIDKQTYYRWTLSLSYIQMDKLTDRQNKYLPILFLLKSYIF